MKVQLSRKFWRCAMFLLVGSVVAAAQSTGKTPAVSQLQSLAVDWRQRGVAGNLYVDDTQTMNQAVLEQKQAGGGEFNWPHHFLTRVSAAINAANTGDLTFRGTGPTSAVVYCGDGTHSVFDLDRAHTIEIRELSIFGHWRDNCTRTYARAGISWDQARAGTWTASNLLVDRVFISPAPQGDIATPDFTCIDISAKSQVNVEDGKFYNIVCHPGGGIGFHIGPSFNPKNEIFFNNNVSSGKYGYKFDSGSWHIQYGEVGNFTVAGIEIDRWTDPVSIDGVLSEANRQFLSIGTGPILHPITLSHINNGWDDKATAPCFWDIGGAQFAFIFSNSWGQSNVASPHHVCGNGHSSAIFLNNGFAWKSYGSTFSTQNAQFYLPPEEMKQLLGASYGFYGGGNILLGTAQKGQYFNNGVSFINSSGGIRRGFRYSADNTFKQSGALPPAADHIFIGDGVIEIGGPGAPSFVLPGCAVEGKDFSVPYGIFLFALDSGKRRSSESHTFCDGPKTLDASHTVSFAWEPTPEAVSYDVVVIFSTRGGQVCFAGNTTAASMTISSPLNCNYKFPLQNEAEYIKTRGRGIWGFGPANETTPTWSIDTASGSASFSGGVNAAKLQGIADTNVVANLNADRVDGKHAADFTAAPVAAPKASASACTAGSWAYDGNYVYVCVGTNTWKRTALASW